MTAPVAPATVLILGNPNVGKTSLFNRLTGGNARVGNYPGMTVERRAGMLRVERHSTQPVELVDTPGTYSLSARSAEEAISLWALFGTSETKAPDALVVVVDAGQLSRCLYLALELIEFRIPLVLAVNMVDEVPGIDVASIETCLGVRAISTNGQTGSGVAELAAAIDELLAAERRYQPKLHVAYGPEVLRAADLVANDLPAAWLEKRASVESRRALALWALGSLDEEDELKDVPDALRKRVLLARNQASDLDLAVVTTRYQAIDRVLEEIRPPDAEKRRRFSENVDRVLLHPVAGTVTFFVVMLALFQALFAGADPMIGWIEAGVSFFQSLATDLLPESVLRDLLTEGVIGGVGNVIVFLPQICLLFLFIGLLEDSGYMARIAYLVDRVMNLLGLHGRAFVPMLSGFACAVPAILSTRTLERERDRLLTMMVVPLMTCSARLPVYTLLIGALFPPESFGLPVQGFLLLFMYVFSMVLTLFAAWVLSKTIVRGKSVPLLLELPPYRKPRLAPTFRMMKRRAADFLWGAGTVILGVTVVLWALLSFPRPNCTEDASATPPVVAVSPAAAPPELPSAPAESCAASVEQSYGARIGKAFEPVIEPLGFDWKIGTGILGAFAAREVFVSTLALVYGVDSADDDVRPLRERIRAERRANGEPVYTPLVGLSLMVFFALACQCMSTLAAIYRETRGYKYPAFVFAYMTVLAYASSFIVYQGGRLLGF